MTNVQKKGCNYFRLRFYKIFRFVLLNLHSFQIILLLHPAPSDITQAQTIFMFSSVCLVFTSACINVIIYGTMHRNIRSTLRGLFHIWDWFSQFLLLLILLIWRTKTMIEILWQLHCPWVKFSVDDQQRLHTFIIIIVMNMILKATILVT